jgi:hypothetical protein
MRWLASKLTVFENLHILLLNLYYTILLKIYEIIRHNQGIFYLIHIYHFCVQLVFNAGYADCLKFRAEVKLRKLVCFEVK